MLEAALDREPKVRSHVALVLGLLLQARLIHPMHLYPMTEVVLEKLGDPDVDMKMLLLGCLPMSCLLLFIFVVYLTVGQLLHVALGPLG